MCCSFARSTLVALSLQGLPRDAEVAALRQLFEPLAGLRDIRLPMLPVDRHGDGGGGCRGYAFLVSTVMMIGILLGFTSTPASLLPPTRVPD